MTRIVVVETPDTARRDLSVEESILGPGVEMVRFSCNGDISKLAAACRDVDVILADLAPQTRTVVEQATQCRLISVCSIGFDNIDVNAAREARISVCALEDYCTDEVADHTMALMLALARHLPDFHHQVQDQHLWQSDSIRGIKGLRDMTLGIIGLGKIGQAVARRASGFGMTLLAHDHHPAEHETRDLDVRFCEMPELLASSDVISLNCSLTASNEHLIDMAAFAQMKRRPILINCARGGLVDETALVAALDSGQVSGAGLDVLEQEPPNLATLELAGRPNVIITPHVAYYSDRSLQRSRERSARNVRHFLDGEHDLVRKYVYQANA